MSFVCSGSTSTSRSVGDVISCPDRPIQSSDDPTIGRRVESRDCVAECGWKFN